MLRCTPRCYDDDTYCIALHCNYTISKRKGCISHGRHTKMHTKMLQWWYIQFTWNQNKRIWDEKSKYPYKDKMAERRHSEQKVPFQDMMIPNLVTTDQSVIKTRMQTTTMTSWRGCNKGWQKRCITRRVIPQYFIVQNTFQQGDINCSSLPARLGENGEFEREWRIWEEIIQNEVSLGETPQLISPCISDGTVLWFVFWGSWWLD